MEQKDNIQVSFKGIGYLYFLCMALIITHHQQWNAILVTNHYQQLVTTRNEMTIAIILMISQTAFNHHDIAIAYIMAVVIHYDCTMSFLIFCHY